MPNYLQNISIRQVVARAVGTATSAKGTVGRVKWIYGEERKEKVFIFVCGDKNCQNIWRRPPVVRSANVYTHTSHNIGRLRPFRCGLRHTHKTATESNRIP